MRFRRAVLVAALATAGIACSTALAAPGKKIDTGVDGDFPIAFAHGDAPKPRQLLVRVSANPPAPLEVLSIVTCAKGKKKIKVREADLILAPTAVVHLAKGYKRPDECTLDVQAAYEDANVSGDVKVELFYRPAHKKKGKKKKKKKRR